MAARCISFALLIHLFLLRCVACSEPLPLVLDVDAQPLAAQAERVADALRFLGQPLSPEAARQLAAARNADPEQMVRGVQETLDAYCLVDIHINPESRVKVARGPAEAKLVEHGWGVFLVKVRNEAGVTAPLRASSPNAAQVRVVSGIRPPRGTFRPWGCGCDRELQGSTSCC